MYTFAPFIAFCCIANHFTQCQLRPFENELKKKYGLKYKKPARDSGS